MPLPSPAARLLRARRPRAGLGPVLYAQRRRASPNHVPSSPILVGDGCGAGNVPLAVRGRLAGGVGPRFLAAAQATPGRLGGFGLCSPAVAGSGSQCTRVCRGTASAPRPECVCPAARRGPAAWAVPLRRTGAHARGRTSQGTVASLDPSLDPGALRYGSTLRAQGMLIVHADLDHPLGPNGARPCRIP